MTNTSVWISVNTLRPSSSYMLTRWHQTLKTPGLFGSKHNGQLAKGVKESEGVSDTCENHFRITVQGTQCT